VKARLVSLTLGKIPTRSHLESKKVRARLLTQLRSRGIFSGFIELQHCDTRLWTELDFTILNNVAALLSIVVQQSFDRSKIEMDAKEMRVINEIGNIFRESCGLLTQKSLAQSVRLISEWMNFAHARAYLLEKALLIDVETGESLELTVRENPFVEVCESGRGKIVNAELTNAGDQFFGHDMALLLPLISKGNRLGVFGLWQRLPKKPRFRPQDRELALTIAGHLSDILYADLNIRLVRGDIPTA